MVLNEKLLYDKFENFRFYRKLKRFDKRSGFFTLGVPSLIVMMGIIVTGTFIVDKQLEVKYLREQSLSKRELTLKEEHEEMLKMLNKVVPSDKLDNSVPIPKIED
ncbi:conserved hypothetical protein [Theileria orientalis strain Shintoku]|uniref:Uncharacterized protein n=1 Tax=Theileria orientalis strain Shintoku TaxID=869250 RepID=J4D7R6_THEOR|nr:conserved hypothetical protein [Theileria orientalis strain Shintoku]BAM40305.1 conserved hypothetical protein [Theileria orientalis strain Shintoku]|eukprot:XP_009690606.1 conserved hypothetical protein [Theileria orientalis strain Shintoku]